MSGDCAVSAFATWQGPDWLAEFYLCPPAWVNPALAALAAAVGLAVLYRLQQRGWTVDLETQRSMLTIAWTVAVVLVATLAMVRWSGQPYLVDVGTGVLVGWGGVQAAQTEPARMRGAQVLPSPRRRVLAAWAALGALAVLGPALVAPGGLVVLEGGRWYLAVLAGVMVVYNAAELAEDA